MRAYRKKSRLGKATESLDDKLIQFVRVDESVYAKEYRQKCYCSVSKCKSNSNQRAMHHFYKKRYLLRHLIEYNDSKDFERDVKEQN